MHAEQNSAVHGLQTIAYIRKRAAHNYAHGVIEIGPFHFVLNIDGDEVLRVLWNARDRQRLLGA